MYIFSSEDKSFTSDSVNCGVAGKIEKPRLSKFTKQLSTDTLSKRASLIEYCSEYGSIPHPLVAF